MSRKRYDAFEERVREANQDEIEVLFGDVREASINSTEAVEHVYFLADLDPKGEYRRPPQVTTLPEDADTPVEAFTGWDLVVEVPAVGPAPEPHPLADMTVTGFDDMGFNELRDLASDIEGVPAGGTGVDTEHIRDELTATLKDVEDVEQPDLSFDVITTLVLGAVRDRAEMAAPYG